MNDRELLELAAKAAGIRHIEYTNDYDGRDGLMLCDEIGRHTSMWSPLTDDGDALRLAVKLFQDIYFWYFDNSVSVGNNVRVVCGDDQLAATRRAIVRAAAEIGRNMA